MLASQFFNKPLLQVGESVHDLSERLSGGRIYRK